MADQETSHQEGEPGGKAFSCVHPFHLGSLGQVGALQPLHASLGLALLGKAVES